MLPYGLGKIQNFQEYAINFFEDPIGIGMIPSLILTLFAQVFCSVALIAGIFSRPAAMILAFRHDDFATLSLPLLFWGIYCLLSFLGGDKYSIDALLFNNKKKIK